MSAQPSLKLLAVIRRKAGMTRQEFFDYHFQEHGRQSEAPTAEETPAAYYQTHFFDGVFPTPPPGGGPPNANYPFSFADDMTELHFNGGAHLKDVMTSQYVKDTIGPDGLNFNDFAAANAILATVEHTIYGERKADGDDSATTADYFVLVSGKPESGVEAGKELGPLLIDAVKQAGGDHIYRIDVTAQLPDKQGIVKYFGAGDPSKPSYTLVFKLFMKSTTAVAAVRKVQGAFETAAEGKVDKAWSMVLFGKRGLVFDQARSLHFDPSRQPRL